MLHLPQSKFHVHPTPKKTKETWQKDTSEESPGVACPLPEQYLQGRPEWPLAPLLSPGYPGSPGESESSASPFSSGLPNQATWGRQKGTVSWATDPPRPQCSSALEETAPQPERPREPLAWFFLSQPFETTVELDTKATIRMNLNKGRPKVLSSWTSRSQSLNKRLGTQHYLFLGARKGNSSKSCCMINCTVDAL